MRRCRGTWRHDSCRSWGRESRKTQATPRELQGRSKDNSLVMAAAELQLIGLRLRCVGESGSRAPALQIRSQGRRRKQGAFRER
jgi:hypothetical protein